MAAYNGERWIGPQIRTIVAQTGVSLDLFISVAPSGDGTHACAQALAHAFGNVHVLPEPGPAGGAAANFFHLLATVPFEGYDYVALADQDDIWYPGKLAHAVEALVASGAQGYSGNVRAFWPDGRSRVLDKAQPQVEWDHLFEGPGPGCTFVMSAAMAHLAKEQITHLGDRLLAVDYHDWFLYSLARSRGFPWFIDPVVMMDYRQHGQNQIGANSGWASITKRLDKVRDGWWFEQVRLLANITGQDRIPEVSNMLAASPHSLRKLARKARLCRRRLRDRLIFPVLCLIEAVHMRRRER